jgi:hypothetical protein
MAKARLICSFGQEPQRLIVQKDKSILFRPAASTQCNRENTYTWDTITKYRQPHIEILTSSVFYSQPSGRLTCGHVLIGTGQSRSEGALEATVPIESIEVL